MRQFLGVSLTPFKKLTRLEGRGLFVRYVADVQVLFILFWRFSSVAKFQEFIQ